MTFNNSEEKVMLPSQSENKSDEHDSRCPVCSAPTLCSCRTCKKISYCSKAHQRSHWKQHKSDCYPLIVEEDEFLGSRLIATRTIKKGEVILREKPLVSGPKIRTNISTESEASFSIPAAVVCLGCFNIVKSDYTCSTCFWPVCGPQCEEGVQHRENECKIFASSKILPCTTPLQASKYKYEAITVLRGVLLRENDPIKWQKIKDLRTKLDENREVQAKIRVEGLTNFCTTFIQDQCTLAQFTEEDIDTVSKVFCTQAFEIHEVESFRNGLHLFHTASFADQNCIPNSSWTIQPNFEIYLRALLPISFGERVSISHTNVTQGTAIRQKELWRRKCLNCTCERCTSPSELRTFFSAIKCPCHSSEGYLITNSRPLLSEDLGSRFTEWKCNECGEKNDADFYQEILTSFKTDMSSINILDVKNSFESVVKLEENVHQHLGLTLHPNHFEIYQVEMEISQMISKELDGNDWSFVDDKLANLVEKFITLSQKWLTVADILWPGYSEQRGLLLNFLQKGLTMSLIIIISMNMKNKEQIVEETLSEKQLQAEFIRILQTRKEVLEIFCLHPEESQGRRIAESMIQEDLEIKILRKRFHCISTENCSKILEILP